MRKLVVLISISLGAAVSLYLALYELGALTRVWDPFFGDGSQRVLHSALARSLPVPDALLGLIAYLFELGLAVTKDFTAQGKRPWTALLLGIVATLMALAGLFLTAAQIFIVHAFCTLCLCSAGLSLVVFGLSVSEGYEAYRLVRGRMKHGAPLREALFTPVELSSEWHDRCTKVKA